MDALRQAKELVDKILKMTKSLVLTGVTDQEEREIEAYATLMEERGPLVAKLIELKKEIDAEMASTPEFAAITQTISSITDLDKKNLEFIGHTHDAVLEAIRRVKQGRKIHAGYTDIPPDSGSRMFDKMQ